MTEKQPNKIMRSIYNAPWYIRNNIMRGKLKIDTITQIAIRDLNKTHTEFMNPQNSTLRECLKYYERNTSTKRRRRQL